MLAQDRQIILNSYFQNNASKINNLVKKIIVKYGGIKPYEYEDFYDIANEHIYNALLTWNPEQCPFDAYFYMILQRKIKTEITRRNRIMRKIDREAISVDAIGEGDDAYTIADNVDIERRMCNAEFSLGLREYLTRLPSNAKKIVVLLIDGYDSKSICKIIGISKDMYDNYMSVIKDPDNIMLLFREDAAYVDRK